MRAAPRLAFAALLAATIPASTPATMRYLAPTAYGGGVAADTPPLQRRPLPALPLPAGTKLMCLGDSHCGFNSSGATSMEKGLIEAAWQSDPRFNFASWTDPYSPLGAAGNRNNGANQGVPGDHLIAGGTLPGVAPRLRYALSREPAIVWLDGGTNDVNSGSGRGRNDPQGAGGYGYPASAAFVEAKLRGMIEAITAHGRWVILSTFYPRCDWPSGDPRHQIHRDINDWIRGTAAAMPGVRVYDPYDDLVSPTDPDGCRAQYFLEGASGVHLNASGVQLVSAKYLLPLIRTMVAPGSVFDQSAAAANLWPATTYGLTGTTGTKVGAQTSGNLATGYTLRMTRAGAGASQVASKDTADATFNRQLIAITPGTGASWSQTQLSFPALPVTTATLPPGSWVRAFVRVETPLGKPTTNVQYTVNANNASGTAVTSATAGFIDSTQYNSVLAPAEAGRGVYWLSTKPFQIPADGSVASLNTQMSLNWWGASYPAGTVATIAVDRPILRIVPDPRPAWLLR